MRVWTSAALVALVAALAVGAGWLAMTRGGGPDGGVAILGDAAPDLHAAMGTRQALPLRTASFTIVSVGGWERLRYIPDMEALCGAACSGETGLVRAVRLSPAGSRKIVFVNLDAWPGLADTEVEGGGDFGCLADSLAAERSQVGPAALPDCADAVPVTEGTRWILPLGLGVL
jgi:hypothetical protein